MEADKTNKNEQTPAHAGESLLEQAEALIWALLDDEIAPADLRRLEGLLRDNAQARERYFSCVQMHVDLHGHFRPAEAPPSGEHLPDSPVLGLLGELRAATGSWPPVSE